MTKNFEDLKLELLEHDQKIRQEDDIQRDFNALSNNQSLRLLCDEMQKNFPKQPSFQDINAMIYVYTNLKHESINEKDKDDWIRQIDRFTKKCPENYEDQRRLQYTMLSLKKAGASPQKSYLLGKKIVEKLTPDSPYRQTCNELQFENVDNYYKYVMEQIQDRNNFSSYIEQTKAYGKAANLLLEIKPTVRWSRHNDFSGKMYKHYMQSEWGRVNFIHDSRKISKKIFASLPTTAKQAIQHNNNMKNYYLR